MSGGSYNYLWCHTSNLTEYRGDLDEIAERLNGLPWAAKAAAETRRVQALLDEAQKAAEGLEDVWHAVEWWDSCDWGEGQARETIERWQAKCSPDVEATEPNNLEP